MGTGHGKAADYRSPERYDVVAINVALYCKTSLGTVADQILAAQKYLRQCRIKRAFYTINKPADSDFQVSDFHFGTVGSTGTYTAKASAVTLTTADGFAAGEFTITSTTEILKAPNLAIRADITNTDAANDGWIRLSVTLFVEPLVRR